MTLIENERCCTKCQMTFPLILEYFKPNARSRGGLDTQCRLCIRAYNTNYARANRDRRNATLRARRAANPEKTKAKAKHDTLLYKERKREYMQQWCQKNRERRNAYERARKQTGTIFWSVAEAAKRLDVAEATVYYLIRQGRLNGVRRGAESRLMIRASEVQEYSPRRPKSGQGRGKVVPLDAPFLSGSGVLGDVIADPAAQDPAEIVLRQAEASAILDYVKAVLTDKQRRVLEVFAECDLDDQQTAKECGMTPSDVRRYLTCIQKRAVSAFSSSGFPSSAVAGTKGGWAL